MVTVRLKDVNLVVHLSCCLLQTEYLAGKKGKKEKIELGFEDRKYVNKESVFSVGCKEKPNMCHRYSRVWGSVPYTYGNSILFLCSSLVTRRRKHPTLHAINVWLPHFPSHVVPGHVLITWSEWPLACRSTERPGDETKRKESFILVQN